MNNKPILEIKKVSKFYKAGGRRLLGFTRGGKRVAALKDVSMDVFKGETLVILGESGSGKTTLARIITGLEILDEGEIIFKGESLERKRKATTARGKVQMVFQDASSSLDPYYTVLQCVSEPLFLLREDKDHLKEMVIDALLNVGLDETYLGRNVKELSGGQKQRIAIARAIISNPDIIVFDEATSSLDVSIQAQVLNLLVALQEKYNFTYIFITHDFNVAKFMADRVCIIYSGKVMEVGVAKSVLSNPKHPYSNLLKDASPMIGKKYEDIFLGDPDETTINKVGEGYCIFYDRCRRRMDRCLVVDPPMVKVNNEEVACLLYDDKKP